MGDIKILELVPYVTSIITATGLFLLIISQHDFFAVLSPSLRRIPKQLQRQFQNFAQSQIVKNPILISDTSRVKQDLKYSALRFRGKPLTVSQLLWLSLFTGILAFIISWTATTKTFTISTVMPSYSATKSVSAVPSTYNSLGLTSDVQTTKQQASNLPADILSFCLGFIFPRWYVFLSSIRAGYMYQKEAPQSLHCLASALRRHDNVEIGIINGHVRLQKHTRKLFEEGIRRWRANQFGTFSEAMYWIARESRNPMWDEFATFTLTASSTGMKDLVSRITDLTSRAEELLAAQKEERKNMRFQGFMALFAFGVLLIQILSLTFRTPDIGMYLYTTPIGKLLIALVFLAVFIEIMIFTWLHYKV